MVIRTLVSKPKKGRQNEVEGQRAVYNTLACAVMSIGLHIKHFDAIAIYIISRHISFIITRPYS